MLKPSVEINEIKLIMREARSYLLAKADGRIKDRHVKLLDSGKDLSRAQKLAGVIDRERTQALSLLLDLTQAATDDVNEKGGSGNLLGRLSDAKEFLAERTKGIRYE
jgi:hypothetical protein